MQLVQTLITPIAQAGDVRFGLNATLFVQGKVMLGPAAVRRTDNLFGALINYHLAFQGVALLLATVGAPLFFSGMFDRRFAGIHNYGFEDLVSLLKPFLTGKGKALLVVKIISTRCTMRQTDDSCSPQDVPK